MEELPTELKRPRNHILEKMWEIWILPKQHFWRDFPKAQQLIHPSAQIPTLPFKDKKKFCILMVVNKFITDRQETAAENEKLTFIANKTQIEAPHFVMYIRQLLVDKYGEDMVEKGGLEVTTSLDLPIQRNSRAGR